jgi:hypothetical protein
MNVALLISQVSKRDLRHPAHLPARGGYLGRFGGDAICSRRSIAI